MVQPLWKGVEQVLLKVKLFTGLSGSLLSYLYKRNENAGPQTCT